MSFKSFGSGCKKGTYENNILLHFQTLGLHVDMEQLQNTLKASSSVCPSNECGRQSTRRSSEKSETRRKELRTSKKRWVDTEKESKGGTCRSGSF